MNDATRKQRTVMMTDAARIGDTLARMEHSLACLDGIERLRLVEDPETWKAVNERVEARLALERRRLG